MNELLLDYLPLVIFIGVALVISLVLLLVPFVVAYQAPDPDVSYAPLPRRACCSRVGLRRAHPFRVEF